MVVHARASPGFHLGVVEVWLVIFDRWLVCTIVLPNRSTPIIRYLP